MLNIFELTEKHAVIHTDHFDSHNQFTVKCGQHSVAIVVRNGVVAVNQGKNNPLCEFDATQNIQTPDDMAHALLNAGFTPMAARRNGWEPVFVEWQQQS